MWKCWLLSTSYNVYFLNFSWGLPAAGEILLFGVALVRLDIELDEGIAAVEEILYIFSFTKMQLTNRCVFFVLFRCLFFSYFAFAYWAISDDNKIKYKTKMRTSTCIVFQSSHRNTTNGRTPKGRGPSEKIKNLYRFLKSCIGFPQGSD